MCYLLNYKTWEINCQQIGEYTEKFFILPIQRHLGTNLFRL